MKSCAFFGHRDYSYGQYEEKIKQTIVGLIQQGVEQFYSGNRGNFDTICSKTVFALKDTFPKIKNTLIVSYHPTATFYCPPWYDDSLYILERAVPRAYAIAETNKRLVEISDIIVSGVVRDFGGAWKAIEYATKKSKKIINIPDWLS